MAKAEFLDSQLKPVQHLTISIGICTFPVDAQTFQEVIRAADSHLYSAKGSGKDKICFSDNGQGKVIC